MESTDSLTQHLPVDGQFIQMSGKMVEQNTRKIKTKHTAHCNACTINVSKQTQIKLNKIYADSMLAKS